MVELTSASSSGHCLPVLSSDGEVCPAPPCCMLLSVPLKEEISPVWSHYLKQFLLLCPSLLAVAPSTAPGVACGPGGEGECPSFALPKEANCSCSSVRSQSRPVQSKQLVLPVC